MVFVDLAAATLPDQCGAIAVVGPGGTPLYTGCVIGGGGDGEVTLRAGGVHRVVFDPNNRATGAITLRLTT